MVVKKHQKLAIVIELIILPSIPVMFWLWVRGQIVLVGMVAAGAIAFGFVGLWAIDKVKNEEIK